MSILRFFGFLSFFIFLQIGCSDGKIVSAKKEFVTTQGTGSFCISPAQKNNRLTKFMFVMDKSGSNGKTDPGVVRRSKNIETFYNSVRVFPQFRWGMIGFQESLATAFISDNGYGQPIFTDREPMVRGALTRLRGPDGYSTPYRAALELTRQAVLVDLEKYHQEDSVYIVFFVSDGEPTDLNDSELIAQYVKDLVNVAPHRVFLSTAFYGHDNLRAQELLQKMARAGNGKYINFRNTDVWDFRELIVGPSAEEWPLQTSLAYDSNPEICDNSQIGVD
jgi:hypothetical protein